MESPALYDDGMMEGEDIVYPCKGCGDILEEGKAFELAGNRWHIDCFRCHTCGTLLDSDANLLLLGDGSLICNNCTYSCSACGNKIEDLAILTGDQAFCAGCFRCRSCKRKIDNLRYARTSQGIFCMSCHESLMARRRKKAKAKPSANANAATNGAADKALPSLPPSAAQQAAFAPEISSPPDSLGGTPRAGSPVGHLSSMRVPTRSRDRDPSPLSDDGRRGEFSQRTTEQFAQARTAEDTTLPSSTYQKGRNSEHVDLGEDADLGFLPMAFDPNPAPRQVPRKRLPNDNSPGVGIDNQQSYFVEQDNTSRSASAEREALHNLHFPSVSAPKLSPHIAFQDKKRAPGRAASGTNTPSSNTHPTPSPVSSTHAERNSKPQPVTTSVVTQNDNFSLQEAPKSRKNGVKSSPIGRVDGEDDASPISADSDINPFEDPKLKEPAPAPIPARHADRPTRGDSLAALRSDNSSARSSIDPSTPLASQQKVNLTHSRGDSVSSTARENEKSALQGPPPRASSRPAYGGENFTAPRVPPPPPLVEDVKPARPASTQVSDGASMAEQHSPGIRSAGLPRYTSEGSFTMEREMSRILKGDDHENTSMLRRVSNAVKHGRSFSDRASLSKISGLHNTDSSINSPSTVSSSITSPFAGTDTLESLRAQLRRAHARITDLESEKVNASTVIDEVNSELKEKRTTMAFLDTQREIVVRELETMTRHLERVKDPKQPLDLPALKSNILDDFAESMQKLKDHISAQIEDLMRKRNELTNEITDLIAMKDKGFQEYESLSTKNAQLVDMNNQLLHSIQDGFKANKNDIRSNGLGIYHPGARVETGSSIDMRSLNMIGTESSMHNLLQENDAEPATVLTAPQVVNIRKGQPRKFNWRKGGEKVAKGVTKGIKGAFASGEKPGIDVSQIGMPYGMTQAQAMSGSEQGSMYARSNITGGQGQGFGLFNQKGGRATAPMAGLKDPGLVPAADPSTLFGSELEARCEFEKRIIPNIVMRCIAEVESRGMHVEGIYRKSGGSGQVKSIQAGFEKDSNHDVSDPDLEIHAVTSALKQYFRKLPTPLITYDVYDSLLDAGSVTDKERQVVALRQALAELPSHHKGCLEYLVRHLARVMNLERDNLMTPLNLAVVFAPTIMRPLSIEREMSDGLAQRAAVQAMLEQHEAVFEDE